MVAEAAIVAPAILERKARRWEIDVDLLFGFGAV